MGTCAIWGTEASSKSIGDSRTVISARAGGAYKIASTAEVMIANFSNEERAKLTTWLIDRRRVGELEPLITSYTLNAARLARPLRYSQKRHRLFLMLAAVNFKPGNSFRTGGVVTPQVTGWLQRISAWIESVDESETHGFMQLMIEEGLFTNDASRRFHLSPAGFALLEETESGGAATDQAFVAMWFSPATDAAYEQGIAPAISEAGFRPFRIDQKETVNKIDDEIIAEIRRSRFMVADFTCGLHEIDGRKVAEARGGVYFEAGFSTGLGTPVIWTVRSDCIDEVHFDTRQFAHIVWDDPKDLRRKLVNRIRAIIV